jgi:PLD-like domain/Putative binding domain, N-terminal
MIFLGQGVVEWSGANFSPAAFVPQVPYKDYEDEVIYFSEQLLPSFMTMFDNIWVNTRDYANYANITGTLVRNHPFSPTDPRLNFPPMNSYQDRLIPLIDREPAVGGLIDVDMFRITMARPVDALIRAATRGVRIRMYLEPNEYINTKRPGNKVQMDRLVAAARQYPGTIEIRMRKHLGLNHQKTVWFHAQRVVVFGTSNWSDASDDNQLEANIFTDKLPGDPLNDFLFAELYRIFERKWYNLAPDGSIETEAWRTPTLPPPTMSDNCLDPKASNYGRPLPCVYPPPPTAPPPPPPGAKTIVIWTSKGAITGSNWQVLPAATAAGGAALWNPNAGRAKVAPALAAPPSYVETEFSAMSGVAYHMWVRLRAQDDSTSNDSVHVQFSDAVTGAGSTTRTMGIGSSSSAEFIIQDGPSAGGSNQWGWADNGWGVPGQPIYFQTTGTHTLRIQAREDGAIVDQIVLSPDTYFTVAPGPRDNDTMILPETPVESGGSCSYSVSPVTASAAAGGESLAIAVTGTETCSWSASSNAAWIAVESGASGSGSGSVSLMVAANDGASVRTGTVTIAGKTVTVSQEAPLPPACTGTLSATGTNVVAERTDGSVDVTVDEGCAWSATSDASWLLVTGAASGTGSGTVTFSVSPNSGLARTATLTIAGATYSVSQEAAPPTPGPTCTVTLDKTSMLVGKAEANWIIYVTAPDSTCTWTASADAAWLVVKSTSPTVMPVSGSGYVKVRAVANTGARRVGQFIINGVVYTVTQLGS